MLMILLICVFVFYLIKVVNMCEVFGISSQEPKKINRELTELFSHSIDHPNGWGLALLDRDNYSVEKEPVKAATSKYLKARLQEPIIVNTALAHIRLATVGNMEWKNCHPFVGSDKTGRQWTLVHNGTIFEMEEIHKYSKVQKGETDSECILFYLLDLINEEIDTKGRDLTDEERFKVVDNLVIMSSPQNKLNLLIYDGETLYAHTNYQNSLFRRNVDKCVYISTQPLTSDEWEVLPFTQLIAYQQGVLKFVGTNHGSEYIYDQRSMDQLMLTYAGL